MERGLWVRPDEHQLCVPEKAMIDQSRALELLPGFLVIALVWWFLNTQSITYGVSLLNWQINDWLQRSAGMDGNPRLEPTEETAAIRSRVASALGLTSIGSLYWWEVGQDSWKSLLVGGWALISLLVWLKVRRRRP
jgi:hypothetical protein